MLKIVMINPTQTNTVFDKSLGMSRSVYTFLYEPANIFLQYFGMSINWISVLATQKIGSCLGSWGS